jgi:hypothetical protein
MLRHHRGHGDMRQQIAELADTHRSDEGAIGQAHE